MEEEACKNDGNVENELELSWRDKSAKIIETLESSDVHYIPTTPQSQLDWFKHRPTAGQVNGLLEEAPNDEFLDSEEKNLKRKLGEISNKVKDIAEKISKKHNLKQKKMLSELVVELGVYSTEVENFFVSLIDGENALENRKNLQWSATKKELTLEDLKLTIQAWKNGDYPEDNYLFGLFKNNIEFFEDILTNYEKAAKMSSNYSLERLREWTSKLDELKLKLNVSDNIENLLKIKEHLRTILNIVSKGDRENVNESIENPIILIIEEITSWNKKNLNKEEMNKLNNELELVHSYKSSVDPKDYDWIQFNKKIEGYRWKQSVRISLLDDIEESEIKKLMLECPKDLKLSK